MKRHLSRQKAALAVLILLAFLLIRLFGLLPGCRRVVGPTPWSRADEILRNVVEAEKRYKDGILRDQDADGEGEFASLSKLLPAAESLGFGSLKSPTLSEFRSDLNEALYHNEYIVKVLVPADPDVAEGHACVVAWPLRHRTGSSFWSGRDRSADICFLCYLSPQPVSKSPYAKANQFVGFSGDPRFSGWGNGPKASDIFTGEPFMSKPDFRKWPITTYLSGAQ